MIGQEIYKLAEELFPICRSLTGDGNRETLSILKKIYPDIKIHEIPTGTKVFDWVIPEEWNIKDAWIKDSSGRKIIDFKNNNLHVVSYSEPVDKIVTLSELLEIIYTLPDQPEYIPYVTSYYKKIHGFCMSENQKRQLSDQRYHVYIDSEFREGSLTYGEIIIPGETKEEIFLSTYICHPSLANNELSGPCVAVHLAREISEMKQRRYTYRIIFIPETIGAIAYISENIDEMKANIIAGYNVTCVGDNRTYSYIPSRNGSTLSDKVARNILSAVYPQYRKYSFLDRGSDERQYCAPGVDLPVGSICRSKYGEYPEYHTSADNMGFVSPEGLAGAFEVYKKCILLLEANHKYHVNCLCEPQLGKRGLYPTLSMRRDQTDTRNMLNVVAYLDGTNDIVDLSEITGIDASEVIRIIQVLDKADLISVVE